MVFANIWDLTKNCGAHKTHAISCKTQGKNSMFISGVREWKGLFKLTAGPQVHKRISRYNSNVWKGIPLAHRSLNFNVAALNQNSNTVLVQYDEGMGKCCMSFYCTMMMSNDDVNIGLHPIAGVAVVNWYWIVFIFPLLYTNIIWMSNSS